MKNAIVFPRVTICSLWQWGHWTAMKVIGHSLLLEAIKTRPSVTSIAVHLHF
jgi:hypothetical protein